MVDSIQNASKGIKPMFAPNNASLRHQVFGASLAIGSVAVGWAGYQFYKYYAPRNARYKLIYFNARGVAEPIRFLFALANVEYEDHRFSDEPTEMIAGVARSEEFVRTKESYPFGQVPVLEVNGVVMAQSTAIERYLAKQFGFFGNNDIEGQLIDSVVEHLRDLMTAFKDARAKDSMLNTTTEVETFFSNKLPAGLRYLNRFATAHSTSANHSTLVGSSLSLADIFLFYFLSMFPDQTPIVRICSAYPHLRAVRESVSNQPAIREWLSKRPSTSK